MYKFQFLRTRFACNVPLSDKTFEVVDVSNGFYQTENKEVAEYLTKRSKDKDSDIIPLPSDIKASDVIKDNVQVVSGARSSKDAQGAKQ